ncbi:MAG: hypothetical protein ABIF06_00920 [bacterium]
MVIFTACEMAPSNDADEQQAAATSQMTAQANMEVGMPGITNFQERKLVKMLYELRDQENFSTYTYIVNMQGELLLFCESVGYGIPYAVQFSNPIRTVDTWRGNGYIEQLPQAEPNGLFMPDALSATWVMCVNPNNPGTPRPVYVEPQIVVSPFKLTR